MTWNDFFRNSLADASKQHSRRHRMWHIDNSPVSFRRADGRRLINFATNDYLGLRHDRRLLDAARQSLSVSGVGAGASPLVCGYNLALADLEQRIANWQGTEASLVFSSGLAMNIGVIAALVGTEDLVLSDRLNHASLIDGCRLSGAHKRIYSHSNVDEVRTILRQDRARYRRVLLVTESIFSMDGDCAPLEDLQAVCEQFDAAMLVDEAHASGIYGETGAGVSQLCEAPSHWLGKLGTLSKAVGTCGGYVAGSRDLIEYLVNKCRSYIFSTAIAPPIVAATAASVALIPQLNERREELRMLSTVLRKRLQTQGWQVAAGDSPIVPVIVGENEVAMGLSDRLQAAGFYVPAIRPPTVPPGSARLRISLCALHSIEQIENLAAEFGVK